MCVFRGFLGVMDCCWMIKQWASGDLTPRYFLSSYPYNKVTGYLSVCMCFPKDRAFCCKDMVILDLGMVFSFFVRGYHQPPERNRYKKIKR